MWIPTWVIAGAIPAAFVMWFIKVWKYDIPRQNKAAIESAAREKRDLAEHLANQKRADRILESLVSSGAPSCILSVRQTGNEAIEGGDQPMSPTQALQSYLRFHEAMKLYDLE